MSHEDRIKWDERYAAPENAPCEPCPLLLEADDLLPRSGAALDIAGGAGRNAIWLAARGLNVTLADISPRALEIAERRASGARVKIKTVCIDVETEPLPPGPWDLITTVLFLRRPLYEAYPQLLTPGGMLLVVHPTESNLQRHAKPPRPFLIDDGELPSLAAGLEIIRYTEGWSSTGRHDAVLVARKAR